MAEAETTTPAEENISPPTGSGLSATVNAAAKGDEKPAETTAQTPPKDTPSGGRGGASTIGACCSQTSTLNCCLEGQHADLAPGSASRRRLVPHHQR